MSRARCRPCLATCRQGANKEQSALCRHQPMLGLVAATAVALTCMLSPPAWAEIQTVAPSEATSFARTLPKQTVNKGKIWVIFLLGATGLFGAALAIERNSKLFPAIARANQALAATKAAQKRKEADDKAVKDTWASEAKAEDAVLQGLSDARSRVRGSASSSQPAPPQPTSNGSSTPGHSGDSIAAAADRAIVEGGKAQEDDTSKQRGGEKERGGKEGALGSSSSGNSGGE